MVAVKSLPCMAHRFFGAVCAVCLNHCAAHEKAALFGESEGVFCHAFSLSNKCNLSVKGGILRVIDGLAPLVACAFFRHGNGNVRKPLVFDGAMPMFDFGRNIHHIARLQTACRFAGFLIPAFACRANQDLTRAVVYSDRKSVV